MLIKITNNGKTEIIEAIHIEHTHNNPYFAIMSKYGDVAIIEPSVQYDLNDIIYELFKKDRVSLTGIIKWYENCKERPRAR